MNFNDLRANILRKVPLKLNYIKSLMFWKYKDNYFMNKIEDKLSQELDVVKIVKNQRAVMLIK